MFYSLVISSLCVLCS